MYIKVLNKCPPFGLFEALFLPPCSPPRLSRSVFPQILRRKAEERNPDEFYFAMQNSRTRRGVAQVSSTRPNAHSQEELHLMRTQDRGYVCLQAQAASRRAERLQDSLHGLGLAEPRHVVFVDDAAEQRAFDPEAHFQTPKALLARTHNRPRLAQLAAPDALAGSGGQSAARVAAGARKRTAAAYRELEQRRERADKLRSTADKMEMQQRVAGGGRKRKLKPQEAGGRADVFKWARERQR